MVGRNEHLSKLETIAATAAGAVIATEYVLCYNNYDGLHATTQTADRVRLLPINNSNFGDVPELFTSVLVAGMLANKIERYGAACENKVVQYLGRHFPSVTAAVVATYYALGETVLPEYFLGTPDVLDVPAVILTAVSAPVLTQFLRKKWHVEWKQRVTMGIDLLNEPQDDSEDPRS
jgi:hypothetical protein